MDRTPRCRHCGDVIGVYESMIVRTGGRARPTSRAVEREAGEHMGECYHYACYVEAHGENLGELGSAT
jgi:hypothetical protein